MHYTSHSVEDTRLFAKEQALEFTRKYEGTPLVIALEGELGAGKTTFTQAFAEVLGVKETLKSPTFVLMKQYELHGVPFYSTLYHIDCYRINDVGELHIPGFDEMFRMHGNIVLIEWAERVRAILPNKHLVIHIDHVSEHIRNILVAYRN